MWFGESEANVRDVFDKARYVKMTFPVIIYNSGCAVLGTLNSVILLIKANFLAFLDYASLGYLTT